MLGKSRLRKWKVNFQRSQGLSVAERKGSMGLCPLNTLTYLTASRDRLRA